jgi:hypothetical protein
MSGMNLRLASAIIGGSAVVGAAAMYVGVTSPASEVDTAKSTVHSSSKPANTPTVTMAVPGITGPAPLYAGQDPGH